MSSVISRFQWPKGKLSKTSDIILSIESVHVCVLLSIFWLGGGGETEGLLVFSLG
jgi:hypothetical protein